MNVVELFRDYRKALKVVTSCTEQKYQAATQNYLNLFFLKHTTPAKPEAHKIDFINVREGDYLVVKMYRRLLTTLENKRKNSW